MATHPLVVSYFTPDTPYEAHALALARSVRELGLDCRIEPRPSAGSWTGNCAQKALFIRDMHRAEGRPILWVDADGRMRRPLDELSQASADLAVVRREGWSFYGGQIYFGAGPAATALIDRWCAYCEADPHVWDQVSLGYAWWDRTLAGPLDVLWLPEAVFAKRSRSWIKRRFQDLFGRAAVVHEQESRRSKRRFAGEIAEFGTADVPDWWRTASVENSPFPLSPEQRRELGLVATPA